MLDNIQVLCHSSILIKSPKIIYIDPFRIKENYNDADIIMITHSHYDHYSEEDIKKVKKQDTIIFIPKEIKRETLELGFDLNNIIEVAPLKNYKIDEIEISTIPAYNTNKKFHPKENGWVGYLININGVCYYIAGDTDITEENKNIKCDVALVPVGGTYTMDFEEAAQLINYIKPKVAIPTHYGSIVGTKKDGIKFSKLLLPEIECKIMI